MKKIGKDNMEDQECDVFKLIFWRNNSWFEYKLWQAVANVQGMFKRKNANC